MMNLLRGAHAPHEASPSKHEVAEPTVKEVVPSPELEKRDPIRYSQQPSSPARDALTVLPKRQSRPVIGTRTTSGRYVTGYLKEQHIIIRDRCRQRLGAGFSSHVFDSSYTGLLEWIRAERLTRLPHKGSAWDRVLSGAHYFAEQVHTLHETSQDFTAGSGAAANLIFGQCLLLLELGHENASALRKVFKLFYQFGTELAALLKRAELFRLDISIQEGIGNAFVDLLSIVSSIAVQFHLAVHGSTTSVALDIYVSFGVQIDTFRHQVASVAQHMWAASLEYHNVFDGPSVSSLRSWLAPQDSVLAFLSSHHVDLVNQPADYTCVWFQSHLMNFLRGNEKIMLVEGKAGFGKSTLAHWVTDRLQRPIGRKSVSSISFSFNQTIPAQSTSLSMVKTLLYQLLEQRIGDVSVYEAIEQAHQELKHSRDVKVHEDKLWTALSKILSALNSEQHAETLAVVIDGIDENPKQKNGAPAISKRLQDLARRFACVRLIQFSAPLEMGDVSNSITLKLTEERTNDDLRTLLHQSLHHTHSSYREASEIEQDKITERLVVVADGSLLWAGLASHLLRLQPNHAALVKTSEELTANKISEVVLKLLAIMQLTSDAKSIISWLCAAERPLQFAELKALMQASPEKGITTDRAVDVQGTLRTLRPFIVVGEGLVAIRHLAIKHALVNIANSNKLSLQLTERQRDLLVRLLIYSKAHTRDDHDVTFKPWEMSVVTQRFQKHQLLEYAVRYWAEHLRKIPSYKAGDMSQFSTLKDIFPSSVTFSILERTCWGMTSFLTEVVELHLIASRIRQTIFGETHACVLQSFVSYTSICETLSMTSEAIKYCAFSSKLSRALYGVQSEITVSCSTWLLRISETSITRTRTEIMTYREETYLLLVECYKHSYGEHSIQVLEIYKKLAELYVFISEEHRATEIYKIIQVITITIYGGHSEEARSISGHLGVVLKKHDHTKEIDTYEGSFFGGFWEESVEEFSLVVVERIIIRVAKHIACGEFALAEELYIELWLKLTEKCRAIEIVEWHECKIRVMTLYAEFLITQKRTSEATSLLLCIWREYEFHAFSVVEAIVLHLKQVAVLMKKVSLLVVALSVFKKCWSFFKSTHKTETSIYREIEEHITITSREVVEKTTKTTITSSSSETVIREVFESSFSSSTTEVSSTTIELCKSLSSLYIREERYCEAIKCIKSVVKRSWSPFFSSSFESTTTISSSSLELVMQLAICYVKQTRIEKAESIYIRLYRAVRACHKIDHELVIKYSEILIQFYISHKIFNKAISFYQELLVEYRAFYGVSHHITTRTLYALGDLCRLHYRTHGYWIEYYLEIVTSLNKGAIICHHDALRALVIVAECYFEDCRYSESLAYYKVIAATFFQHGTTYEYFKSITEVQMLFEHYERSMIESKIEISVQIKMLKEYRESCVRHFGATSSITISATMSYASVCMKSESHQYEAISLYEHVMKHSSHSETTTIVKKSLRSLYVKQITQSSKSTTITKEVIETATKMTYEHYVEIRKAHSCTHEKTISSLMELIQLYYKQSKVEVAVKELREFIVKCITEVSSSKELIAVAVSIAAIYRSCGYIEHAHILIRELKMQIIFKSTSSVSKCGFSLVSVGRVAFAFLAAFEAHMLQVVTVTELMAEYAAMSLYYERYSVAIKSKSSLAIVFTCGAKLRHLLGKRERIEYYYTIEREIYSYFSSSEVRVIQGTGSESAVKLFLSVLLEHFVEHSVASKNFVAIAGRAASARIRLQLEQKKIKEALELCRCTYQYLLAHEGLDDPTEISQGFTLCLMMAGRGYPRCNDAALAKQMMELSRTILKQVLEIVKTCKIDLVRCKLEDLNQLIGLMGEQQDYANLVFLLSNMWRSREGQKWSKETTSSIARRLIQAYFRVGNYSAAIRLAEDMLYNVRRVHGSRSATALSFYDLLGQLYTSAALQLQQQESKTAKDTAKTYLRKAADVHADVLKMFVDISESSDDEEDDLDSEISSAPSTPTPGCGHGYLEQKKEQDEAIKRHTRHLKLAFQRLGGWTRDAREFEKVTDLVWQAHGKEMGMDRKAVMSREWSAQGFGAGKAESKDDEFVSPTKWEMTI